MNKNKIVSETSPLHIHYSANMARKNEDGTKRGRKDKMRERFDRQGKYSAKHIRIQDAINAAKFAKIYP